MECEDKQFRFNIWSENAIQVPLEENKMYTISHAEMNAKKIFNFGESSKIEKCMEVEDNTSDKIIHTVTQLEHIEN